ncbi:MAG: helix-turn-helix domain-containing protein [Phycisphaerales bacterium]|nr:MAG: helix-turn-helix domain-containing protein [Phycisphaerales bacterium]
MSYTHLTVDERNVIYRMRWQGYSAAEIARCLGRGGLLTCEKIPQPSFRQAQGRLDKGLLIDVPR